MILIILIFHLHSIYYGPWDGIKLCRSAAGRDVGQEPIAGGNSELHGETACWDTGETSWRVCTPGLSYTTGRVACWWRSFPLTRRQPAGSHNVHTCQTRSTGLRGMSPFLYSIPPGPLLRRLNIAPPGNVEIFIRSSFNIIKQIQEEGISKNEKIHDKMEGFTWEEEFIKITKCKQ